MPVCLKCGKEIDPPGKFCEECGALGERETRDALSGPQSNYKPRREHNTVSFIVLAVVLFAIIGGLGYAMLTLLPNSKKIQTEAQANICHRNLVSIQQAIDKYYQNSHLYPPPGKLTTQSPLVVDRYIKNVPTCPTTGHDYILKSSGISNPSNQQQARVTVHCDSGLKGHTL